MKARKIKKYTQGGTIRVKKYQEGGKTTGSGYSEFLDYVISKKGGKPDDYMNLQNAIAYHETGPQQRLSAEAVQLVEVDGELKPEGIGRGLFMFEAGKNAGGITAVNRTYNEYKKAGLEVPGWLGELHEQDNLDASQLTDEQQRVLFLGNYMQHPKANLGDVISGKLPIRDFWGQFHHAGKDTNYEMFDQSYKSYIGE